MMPMPSIPAPPPRTTATRASDLALLNRACDARANQFERDALVGLFAKLRLNPTATLTPTERTRVEGIVAGIDSRRPGPPLPLFPPGGPAARRTW